MGREINRLTARRVQTLAQPGRHADGGGLYLVIDTAGARRWVVFYRMGGKRREMGLGSALSVSLARARDLADAARKMVADGLDPIDARQQRASPAPPPVVSFADVATQFMAMHEHEWRNAKHR